MTPPLRCAADVPLVLAEDEVHVWSARLDPPGPTLGRLARTLSAEEGKKAAAFRFERDQRRFVAGRGFVREILGRYLGIESGRLEFEYGPHGKPSLSGGLGAGALRFNLSHSGEIAVYAIAAGREVGIDVEALRDIRDAGDIVERFFSPVECLAFRLQAPAQRQQAFFTSWTRKEAYLKAIGDGLARPLDQFDVTLAPGKSALLLRVQGEPGETERWSLRDLAPAPGYVAALAAEGHDWRPRCGEWRLNEPEEPARSGVEQGIEGRRGPLPGLGAWLAGRSGPLRA